MTVREWVSAHTCQMNSSPIFDKPRPCAWIVMLRGRSSLGKPGAPHMGASAWQLTSLLCCTHGPLMFLALCTTAPEPAVNAHSFCVKRLSLIFVPSLSWQTVGFHKESDAEQSVSFLTVAGGATAAAVDDVVSPLPLEDHHALHKIVGEEPPDLDLRALTQVLRLNTHTLRSSCVSPEPVLANSRFSEGTSRPEKGIFRTGVRRSIATMWSPLNPAG